MSDTRPGNGTLSPELRAVLRRWADEGGALATRAGVVLLAADGLRDAEISRRLGVSRQTVGSWRQRWTSAGIDGLEHRPRTGRPATVDEAEVVTRTLLAPGGSGASRAVARELGLSHATVAGIRRRWRLVPDEPVSPSVPTRPPLPGADVWVMGLYVDGLRGVLLAAPDWSRAPGDVRHGDRRGRPGGPRPLTGRGTGIDTTRRVRAGRGSRGRRGDGSRGEPAAGPHDGRRPRLRRSGGRLGRRGHARRTAPGPGPRCGHNRCLRRRSRAGPGGQFGPRLRRPTRCGHTARTIRRGLPGAKRRCHHVRPGVGRVSRAGEPTASRSRPARRHVVGRRVRRRSGACPRRAPTIQLDKDCDVPSHSRPLHLAHLPAGHDRPRQHQSSGVVTARLSRSGRRVGAVRGGAPPRPAAHRALAPRERRGASRGREREGQLRARAHLERRQPDRPGVVQRVRGHRDRPALRHHHARRDRPSHRTHPAVGVPHRPVPARPGHPDRGRATARHLGQAAYARTAARRRRARARDPYRSRTADGGRDRPRRRDRVHPHAVRQRGHRPGGVRGAGGRAGPRDAGRGGRSRTARRLPRHRRRGAGAGGHRVRDRTGAAPDVGLGRSSAALSPQGPLPVPGHHGEGLDRRGGRRALDRP